MGYRAGVLGYLGWAGRGPLVIAVGRLEPEKRYDLLVRAIGSLLARFPSMRCLLVGDGRCRAELAALADSLDIAHAVKLAGARDDVPDLLGAADTFVLSSSREGLPVSLLEAMAAGKAIVSTAVGGIPETIRDRENGLLVPPEDVGALAGAIGAIAADPSLGAALGRAARADAARDYAIERVVGRIEDLYRDLCERKRKRA
jgi:glycosyltransferase involved in cell wall biosynthesis